MGSFEVLEITIRRPEKKNIFMRLSTSHFCELLISAVFEIENNY